MSVLALAGAIGGAGKGELQNVAYARQTQLMKTMNDLQEARQAAIERLRGQVQSGLESQRIGGEKALESQREGSQMNVARMEMGARANIASQARAFESRENALNRQSRERVAHGHDVARERAAGYAHARTQPARWGFQNITVPGATVGSPSRSYSVLHDKQSGISYQQVGDKFLPYDASSTAPPNPNSVRRAADSQVQLLLQHPDQVDNFIHTYHYLPMQWFSQMQRPQPGGGPQAPTLPPFVAPPGAVVSGEQSLGAATPQGGGPGAGASDASGEIDQAADDAEENSEESQDASAVAGQQPYISGNY